LNETDLLEYFKEKKVWFRMIEKETTVHTADAAAATGIPLERITKSLVFLAENKIPMLVIIPGNCVVNKEKLKNFLGVRNVKLASFEEAENYSGYPPGATPPVCHKKIEKVIMDEKLFEHGTVFGGGGSRNKLVEMKSEDIKRLNNALIANVAEPIK
jgi:Cys-tRNA(Pro)/Cys-tRNA(Cys) deacylase